MVHFSPFPTNCSAPEAIHLNRTYSKAYVLRGLLLKRAFEDPQGALEDFDRAIEMDPRCVERRGSIPSHHIDGIGLGIKNTFITLINTSLAPSCFQVKVVFRKLQDRVQKL